MESGYTWSGSPDLWSIPSVFDYGPEGNLEAWEDALIVIAALDVIAEGGHNEALPLALSDCRKRCAEEARRARLAVEGVYGN